MKASGSWAWRRMARPLFDAVDYTVPVALVIGGEGKGLRPLVRRNCDEVVRLPIAGHADSLNASVAAALVLYEVFPSAPESPGRVTPAGHRKPDSTGRAGLRRKAAARDLKTEGRVSRTDKTVDTKASERYATALIFSEKRPVVWR